MKRLILSSIVMTSFGLTAVGHTASAAEDAATTPTEAFKKGKVSFDMTIGYFIRKFDDPGVDDSEALTGGGMLSHI